MKEHPYTGELGCFTAYMRTNLPHAAICPKRTPYNRSPAESPLHFADRRAESVIMGLLHFRRSAFSSPQTAGVRLCRALLCGEPTSPMGDVSGDSKGGSILGTRLWYKV